MRKEYGRMERLKGCVKRNRRRSGRSRIDMDRVYGKWRRTAVMCMSILLLAAAGCGKKEEDAVETISVSNYEEFALSFYQYGGFVEEDTVEIDPEQFRIYHEGELLGAYSYRKLSDFLISLYEEDAQAYAICRYELADDAQHMTLDLLGATSGDMAGEWEVLYTNQDSTAKLELLVEGLGRETDQFDASGEAAGEETSFFYCFRGKKDHCRLLLLKEDKYYIYEVEADMEQRRMRLTVVEEHSYTQDEDGEG